MGKKEKKLCVLILITNKTTVFVTLRRHRTSGARVRARSRARYRGPTAGPHRVRLCTLVTAAPEPLSLSSSLSAAAARKQHARTHRRQPDAHTNAHRNAQKTRAQTRTQHVTRGRRAHALPRPGCRTAAAAADVVTCRPSRSPWPARRPPWLRCPGGGGNGRRATSL